MLGQMNEEGKTMVEVAIDRIKHFEPAEGYYLAFSGGKDSIVCKELLNMAGVKYDAHYNVTTVDPPELVQYIKKHHPDVIFERPTTTMWKLIPQRLYPPTRIARYCCEELKEGGGIGRFVVTGVRWAESSRRKNTRSMVEIFTKSKAKQEVENKKIFLMSDNEEKRRMIETCPTKGAYILNPIVDWEDDDVWEFIQMRNIPYCELYDQGFTRLGCVGCPMARGKQQAIEFERWPQYRKAYIKAFDEMIDERKRRGKETEWENGEAVMKWWMGE
jgi:phosphoadenosine phosphosulfate reductase